MGWLEGVALMSADWFSKSHAEMDAHRVLHFWSQCFLLYTLKKFTAANSKYLEAEGSESKRYQGNRTLI